MHKAYEYSVTCENLNQKVHSNSIKELNTKKTKKLIRNKDVFFK